MRVARLLGLSLGHLVTDVNQGAVVILVPVVRHDLGLSIGAAALMVTVSTITSSVIQPVLGALSDRYDLRWLMPGGVALAGAGLVLVALADSYPLVILGVLISGVGIAAWHPESSRWAGAAAGTRRATGMSYYSVGGNAGYALGVFAVAPLAALAGRGAIAWLVGPPLIYAAAATPAVARFGRAGGERATRLLSAVRATFAPGMLRLTAVVLLRSASNVGVATLAPLYLQANRDLPLTAAGSITALYLFAGALGTLAGGPLADRFGRRAQMLVSFGAVPPLLFAFLLLPGVAGYVAFAVAGAAVVSTFAVTVVLAQELMPGHQGTASGVMLGFAFGGGGLAVGLLGQMADRVGLTATIAVAALLPLLALPLVWGIPETGGRGGAGEATTPATRTEPAS